jgi:hypothetical protein
MTNVDVILTTGAMDLVEVSKRNPLHTRARFYLEELAKKQL